MWSRASRQARGPERDVVAGEPAGEGTRTRCGRGRARTRRDQSASWSRASRQARGPERDVVAGEPGREAPSATEVAGARPAAGRRRVVPGGRCGSFPPPERRRPPRGGDRRCPVQQRSPPGRDCGTLAGMQDRSLAVVASLALAVVFSAAPVAAQPPAGTEKPQAAAAPDAAPSQRKDPNGHTGISPYTEQVLKGQASFVARDIPGAIAAFQDAIKLDSSKMLGFYLLGEAMLESGNTAEAETAWNTAIGKKGTEELHAKVLFCLADLRERQKNWQAAKEAWGAYSTFLTSNPKATGYPATAAERQKQLDRRMKDEKDYAAVKERIVQREAERQKEAEENAKKDKLNR
ncbi:hypothetical protein predicted by Glimmer/Critica [Sorangium cellulosum So ce56]|uniref:Tetratricopeptide repeat protein n=2 Tax=Sorangium cellulosum TaxID=56 RepID=A9FG12_SORC5|nr:hypothetical protein predicted by Glimmer/Critica [Sorangium cellulosum So ce56]